MAVKRPLGPGLQRSPTRRRFLQHKGGVIGLLVVLAFGVLAVAAPFWRPMPRMPSISTPACRTVGGALVRHRPAGPRLFSRCLFGARISLTIGLISVGIGTLLGLPTGAVSGFVGGWVDRLLMRGVDILLAFPPILLAIIVISIFGPGLTNAMLAIGIAQMPVYARLMRSSVLKTKEEFYVDAARASGASESSDPGAPRGAQLAHAGHCPGHPEPGRGHPLGGLPGLLGTGRPAPTPRNGEACCPRAATFLRTAPHASIFPGLFIMFSVLGFNLFGDGLSNAMDPKFTRARSRLGRHAMLW